MASELDASSLAREASLQIAAYPMNTFLVIGLTGSGKSSFIQSLLQGPDRDKIKVGAGMQATTVEMQAWQGKIGKRTVAFLDTVGFADPNTEDEEITREIVKWIARLRQLNYRFRGIIYTVSIEDRQFKSLFRHRLKELSQCLGEHCKRLCFVTTMWNRFSKEQQERAGSDLDAVRSETFQSFIDGGAMERRYLGTTQSASNIVSEMLGLGDQDLGQTIIRNLCLDPTLHAAKENGFLSLLVLLKSGREIIERCIADTRLRLQGVESNLENVCQALLEKFFSDHRPSPTTNGETVSESSSSTSASQENHSPGLDQSGARLGEYVALPSRFLSAEEVAAARLHSLRASESFQLQDLNGSLLERTS